MAREKENVAENSAIVAENSAKEKENVAENSANVAENSAREKEMWLRIQQKCGRGFGKRKRIVAEISANLWGCKFDKQT